jgi:hypothetical protein
MAYPQSIFLTPFELLERAEAFWTYRKSSPNKPRYFLLYHAVELVFKAYIASRRPITEDEVKKTFGHDLTKLVDEAIRLGLTINPSVQSDIEKFSEAHTEYLARYPKEAANRVLVIDYFADRQVEELFKAVRQKMTEPRSSRFG